LGIGPHSSFVVNVMRLERKMRNDAGRLMTGTYTYAKRCLRYSLTSTYA